MKNLCSPLLAITTLNPYAASPSMTSIRVMAVVEGEQDLHEIIPYSVLGDKAVVSLGLLNDGREVATPAEFHENVQNSRIAVYVSVVIAYVDVLHPHNFFTLFPGFSAPSTHLFAFSRLIHTSPADNRVIVIRQSCRL